MIAAISSAISWSESAITFLFLLVMLRQTYGFRRGREKAGWVGLVLATLFYIALMNYTPLFGDNFVLYLILLTVLGIAYAWLLIGGRFPNAIVTLLSGIFSITLGKGLIWSLFSAYDTGRLSADAALLLKDVLFFAFLILLLFFYQKHPLVTPAKFPNLYWWLMFLMPIAIYLPSRLFDLSPASDLIYHSSEKAYALLLFVEIFLTIGIYYLSYIMIQSYNHLLESGLVNQRQALQLDHLERSISMIEQIRRDKHEMKNIYFYIHYMMETKNYSELEEFVEKKLLHRYDRLEEFNTGNQMVDYLLTQKINEARDYGIHVMASVVLPPDLPLDSMDLCSLLVNLLDNAIDASRREAQGDIQIAIQVEKNYLSVIVRNHSSVDVLAENPHLKTTKADRSHHGVGMDVVRGIVKKYNGILRPTMEAGYFVMDILLEIGAAAGPLPRKGE